MIDKELTKYKFRLEKRFLKAAQGDATEAQRMQAEFIASNAYQVDPLRLCQTIARLNLDCAGNVLSYINKQNGALQEVPLLLDFNREHPDCFTCLLIVFNIAFNRNFNNGIRFYSEFYRESPE